MKSVTRMISMLLILALFLMPGMKVSGKSKEPLPSPEAMTVLQARRALLSGADSLRVPLPPKGKSFQGIDAKSMRISSRSAEFDGADADKYNGGKHHYRILFTSFESVSVQCNWYYCTVASEPPGTLARNESGEALGHINIIVAPEVPGPGLTKCSTECHNVAQQFAAALNTLHVFAQKRQAASIDFHQEAAAWRALNPKPPIPEEVREQRLLAEDAVKSNKPGEALDFYEAGLELYPTWPQGRFNAALIAAELGLYADAVEHMQAYLELVTDASDAQSARDQIVIWRHKAKGAQ